MGKGGGSKSAPAPTQQNVVQTNLPEYAKPYFENIMQRAQAESYRPYTPYEGERLAGFSPGQQAVQQEVASMQTPGQFGVGTGLAGAGGLGGLGAGMQYMNMATNPAMQQMFMSPYMQNVVDVQQQAAIRDAQKSQLAQNLGASRQGTYGGARQLLATTERERALQGQLGDIQARGLQDAFTQAQQAMRFGTEAGLQGYGQAIQAGQTLGQLGAGQQSTDLARLQAQSLAGSEQRELEQQQLDLAYADFLRQRDYPMEQLGYYSNLLRGVPVQLGSTATTYAQPPSMVSQAAGLGLAGLSLNNLLGSAK